MPAPPEDDRKAPQDLIDPELNPMTNSLLAQNMGRWAEIYFTTPAEKREEAVRELLRELKSGVRDSQVEEKRVSISEREIFNTKEKFAELEKQFAELTRKKTAAADRVSASEAPAADEILCPACLSKNKSGQRFCGLCGFTLTTSRAMPVPAPESVKPAPAEQPLASAATVATAERADNDWGWLHEKHRTLLAERQSRGGTWKYAALVVLILILCGAAYVWWRGNLQTKSGDQTSRTQTTQAATTESRPASPTTSPEPESPSARTPSEGSGTQTAPSSKRDQNNDKKAEDLPAAAAAPSEAVATSKGASESAATTATPVEGGQRELDTARRYLDGRGVPKDAAVAAQFLWKSVSKKNTEAIVILSRLYATGDGVPRNCDQARLLLTSAAQKGSSEAKAQLEHLGSTCH